MTPGSLANKKYRKKYPEKRKLERQSNYASTAGPALNYNHRALWTIRELNLLFFPELNDRFLHILIGRSVAAIQKQRWKIRKEKPSNA